MWSRNGDNVIWHKDARSEVYNEGGLRAVIREYLSDKSKGRYAPDRFMDNELYLKGLNHLIEGLSLFYR
jgi:hypothetical protein